MLYVFGKYVDEYEITKCSSVTTRIKAGLTVYTIFAQISFSKMEIIGSRRSSSLKTEATSDCHGDVINSWKAIVTLRTRIETWRNCSLIEQARCTVASSPQLARLLATQELQMKAHLEGRGVSPSPVTRQNFDSTWKSEPSSLLGCVSLLLLLIINPLFRLEKNPTRIHDVSKFSVI